MGVASDLDLLFVAYWTKAGDETCMGAVDSFKNII